MKPSYLAFLFLIISIIFCLINVGAKFFINLIGLIVPAYLALIGLKEGGIIIIYIYIYINIKKEADIHFLLPYFLIFSTMVVFDGVFQYIFSFLPIYNVINLMLVIALFHPDIRLASVIWNLFDKSNVIEDKKKIE